MCLKNCQLSAVFMSIMKATGIATLHYYKLRVCVQNILVLSHMLNLILLAQFYSCYLSFHRLNIRGSWAFIILISLIFNFLSRIIVIFYFIILIKPLSLEETNPVTRNIIFNNIIFVWPEWRKVSLVLSIKYGKAFWVILGKPFSGRLV